MVTIDEVYELLKASLKESAELRQEIEELRNKVSVVRQKSRKAVLHTATPEVREVLEKEELLSSDLVDKCVELIIKEGQDIV